MMLYLQKHQIPLGTWRRWLFAAGWRIHSEGVSGEGVCLERVCEGLVGTSTTTVISSVHHSNPLQSVSV